MPLRKITLAAASFGLTLAASHASLVLAAEPDADAKTQQLEQQIDSLAQQLQALKAELGQLKAQNQVLATQQAEIATKASAPSPLDNVSLWGYGEVYYTHPIHDDKKTQADLARAVFGIGYRFDENTVFNSEYEVEHAVASSEDVGEFEVEQFYVDHTFNKSVAIKAGLFLIPSGLLNLNHEPTNFYGVQRNYVESLIIPATWREGGVGVHGDTDVGIDWDAGVTTGVNLAGRDSNPETPQYTTALDLSNSGAGPLAATHQELSLANAQYLSQYLALGYKGIPGLNLGASIFTGNAAPQDPTVNLGRQRVMLWEAHSRWTPGKFDLSALYARGSISNTGAYNALTPGVSNPTPASFNGWYMQGAYTAWQNNTYRVAPFARWEYYNMGASYEGIAPGFTPVPAGFPANADHVFTTGVNFYITPHVVLKADWQNFHTNKDLSRYDLGLGLAF
ncbi:MAG: porin [Rhizobium sp.]|nr:MAG: porin [Rhizobium sp.]